MLNVTARISRSLCTAIRPDLRGRAPFKSSARPIMASHGRLYRSMRRGTPRTTPHASKEKGWGPAFALWDPPPPHVAPPTPAVWEFTTEDKALQALYRI